MAKQSAVSAVVARIDADLAKWKEIESFMGGFLSGVTVDEVIKALNERITNLLEMRAYVAAAPAYVADAPAPSSEKPKRGRKRKGLPADTDSGATV